MCIVQYKATGRGFVVEHIPFAENYRAYARSHFVKGYEYSFHSLHHLDGIVCDDIVCLFFYPESFL